MADQEHGAIVGLQQLFEQLERVDVQIVGRLVQNQYVGRAGEQTCQQQAVALATRQGTHRGVRTRWREQEVAQVALHVLALVADLDPLAAGTDEVFQRRVEVDGLAHLVEVGDLQIRTTAHFARIRFLLAQNHAEQGRLAGTVRADQSHLVATQNGGGEILDDELFAERLAHLCELRHDLALVAVLRTGGDIHPHAAQRFTTRFAVLTHVFKARDATLCTRAARFHASANPHFFLSQQLVGLGIHHGFLSELIILLRHIRGEVAGVGAQQATVELDDAGRNAIQEGTIVGNGDETALEINQQIFQPCNGVQIQVIGRLIEQ